MAPPWFVKRTWMKSLASVTYSAGVTAAAREAGTGVLAAGTIAAVGPAAGGRAGAFIAAGGVAGLSDGGGAYFALK